MRTYSKALGLCAFILTLCSSFILAQTKNDKTTVGTVGKQKITYGELKKNINQSSTSTYSLSELEEFLPIYLDYIAKIQFAKNEGIFNNETLNAELDVYSKQAAYSYWLDNKIKPTEFQKYYNRATTEIKSQHLLISIPKNAPPEDTLAAYKKLIEARNKFLSGSTIAKLDPEYSSKQNGRSMGGDLPWFSVGTTVKEFEDVIYTLKAGDISMPFRTQFGYHIVYVQDIRERTPARNVSHIFTRANVNGSKEKIDSAFDALKQGRPWYEVVTEFSDDNLSVQKGGNIGWVSYGRFNSDFVDKIMQLDPDSKYSEPIATVYGYHIFKLDSVQSFKSAQQKEEFYTKQFLDSPNYKKSNTFVTNWFKKEYKSSVNKEVLALYEDFIESKGTITINEIAEPTFSNKIIYQFNNYSFSVSDFHKYLIKAHTTVEAKNYQNNWIDEFITASIDSKITEMAVQEFDGFQSEIDNYRKGLAVFQVNDQHLWNAETVDSTLLMKRFNSNRDQYTYPTRYYYHLISARQDTNLQKAVDFIQEGNHPDSIRTLYKSIAVTHDSTGIFTDKPFNKLQTMQEKSFSEVFNYKNRNTRFYLNKILPARRMTFEEAFAKLLTEYQPEREKKWMDKLRKRYKVKADFKKLKKAYNKDTGL